MTTSASEFYVKLRLKALLTKAQQTFPTLYFSSISDRYHSGLPDFFVAHGGKSFFIECKRTGGKLSKIQEYQTKRLVKAGVPVLLWSENDKKKPVIKHLWVESPSIETIELLGLFLN